MCNGHGYELRSEHKYAFLAHLEIIFSLALSSRFLVLDFVYSSLPVDSSLVVAWQERYGLSYPLLPFLRQKAPDQVLFSVCDTTLISLLFRADPGKKFGDKSIVRICAGVCGAEFRFHCEQIGHPLLGDCLYGAPPATKHVHSLVTVAE